MKTLNLKVKTSLAAVTLAAATLLTPAMAHAGDYRYDKCKDTENAVAGAVCWRHTRFVIGKEIAGRGDNTEGAILGAIVGGITGAAIGDGVNDCEKRDDRRVYTTTRGYSSNTGYTTRLLFELSAIMEALTTAHPLMDMVIGVTVMMTEVIMTAALTVHYASSIAGLKTCAVNGIVSRTAETVDADMPMVTAISGTASSKSVVRFVPLKTSASA